MGALQDMLNAQLALQRQIPPIRPDPVDRPIEEKCEFIGDMVLALTDELHEALNEVGWKPWAKSRHINEEAFRSELVDAWHFFMNLMLTVGMTEQDLLTGYYNKRAKNVTRHENQDYDGISSKCPSCHRDYHDDGVKCVWWDTVKGRQWHCNKNNVWGEIINEAV